MAKTLIVGNWKQNKTIDEAYAWLSALSIQTSEEKEVILCPSFIHLFPLQERIRALGLKVVLGSQNFPSFPKGSYTGEEPVEALREVISYSIIGHSERRKYANETDNDVVKKVSLALQNDITPILCLSSIEQLNSYLSLERKIAESSEKIVFVYEPPGAISGGGEFRPENPEEVNRKALDILESIGKNVTILYGGSINPDNAKSFFSMPNISGGLVGQSSLDPISFSQICNTA